MKFQNKDDSLIVDISDALSERDRVRFTVHTKTKLPQFSKPVLSVVRQHEEFIWLHDCLTENDQYAGYIIPPPPPKPDFDSSREKLQRLGDCEASLSKEIFVKLKQELEAEYLAIFKKTVAMHEIFLQRLASHEKFREDSNFKIFLEYENELAVRGKSKREKISDSIQNISKSLSDFVITTSQVAATNSIGSITNYNHIDHNSSSKVTTSSLAQVTNNSSSRNNNINTNNNGSGESGNNHTYNSGNIDSDVSKTNENVNNNNNNGTTVSEDDIDEQYFEKERLFLALYYNSIRETAICADRLAQAHKSVADDCLQIAHQLIKVASIQVVHITNKTVESFNSYGSIAGPLPSLTLPSLSSTKTKQNNDNQQLQKQALSFDQLSEYDEPTASSSRNDFVASSSSASFQTDNKQGDKIMDISTGGCASDHTSKGLMKLLLHVSDYLEQAKKIESRAAADEDLKLTDTFLYYKRDTVAAQDLLARRLRFMSEYDNATKSLEKARVKGRTAMQYADVIQKQAKENFVSISKLAKQELIEYKKRRVSSFKKAFSDLAELEMKHLRSHSQLITNCLNICRGLVQEPQATATTTSTIATQPTGETENKSVEDSVEGSNSNSDRNGQSTSNSGGTATPATQVSDATDAVDSATTTASPSPSVI